MLRAELREQEKLFGDSLTSPLANQLRPLSLKDVVGQNHLLKDDGPIGRMVVSKKLISTILWGPPGSGKTTIARLLANHTDHNFVLLSAVFSGVGDLKRIFAKAQKGQEAGVSTLLFVDEIHRFNKAQQDGFLPYLEDGTIVLIGATTENPSFELNPPLLSRCQVLVLKRLDEIALKTLIIRAETKIKKKLPLDEKARIALIAMSDGDGRHLLNMIEILESSGRKDSLNPDDLAFLVQKRAPLYDKHSDYHYNLISALHKSIRSSDPDASLYWLARMLVGGEDPLFIARRLVRFASEDVGLAEPKALSQALSAWDAYQRLGSPEGELAIAQAVIFLATAPKSNATYVGYNSAVESAKRTGSLPPPNHLLNAPTRLLKEIGYGEGYQYDHQYFDSFSGQDCLPQGMKRQVFYVPVEGGFEREIKKRLSNWEKLRKERNKQV